MTLTGKGYYIWKVKYCEKGDPDRIAALAREANLSHVMIKVADGAFPYNIDLDTGYDYARAAVRKLQAANIPVWGWQYIYGNYPDQEAEIAVARARELGLNGFVINAEKEYQSHSKAPAASRYMNILRNNLGSMPLALSSYRYPSYHAQLPWVNFLDRVDYNMPQVYWMQSHNNAGEQLQRSVNEFKNMRPFRPIIPTGPTFKEHGWIPYQHEVKEFMDVAKKLNLSAVNFWYWEGCRRDLPQFWDLVRDYQYDTPTREASLPNQFVTALNSKDPDKVLNLYADNAVHIRAEKASQGKKAIREWVKVVLNDCADGSFSLISETGDKNVLNFLWEATSRAGEKLAGQNTVGMTGKKILYHYSFIKQPEKAA